MCSLMTTWRRPCATFSTRMFDRKSPTPDVIVVGAGLSGLSCAIHLQRAGRNVVVLEASNGVGGRVRSDIVDGFTLDRGFQVLLTAYPEAQTQLDYQALHLRNFRAGAFVQLGAKRAYVADPLREPTAVLKTLAADVGSLMDKGRIGVLQIEAARRTMDQCFQGPDVATSEYLRVKGFSSTVVQRFFRPFFGGVFLDPDLATSSRMFEFVFTMLANGENAIPANGMGAISDQLAEKLSVGTVRLGQRVAAVEPGRVTLLDQGTLEAPAVVIATEGPQAAKLLPNSGMSEPGSQPVTCLYFSADSPPFTERSILLNGLGPEDGPINNLCVPTNLSASLAPGGKHLISATVLGSYDSSTNADLQERVRKQLTSWFGDTVSSWNHLRTYNISHALPTQTPGVLSPPERPVSLGENLFVCGDHRDTSSIQGALRSGRRTAEAILGHAR